MNKNEKKMIEQIRKDFVARCLKGSDGCDLRDCQYCHAESLYNAGYRKVGKDEIVITKDEYKKLRSAKMTYESEVFKIALEKIEQAKQETAREILTTIYNNLKYATFQQTAALRSVKDLANELGIGLE